MMYLKIKTLKMKKLMTVIKILLNIENIFHLYTNYKIINIII